MEAEARKIQKEEDEQYALIEELVRQNAKIEKGRLIAQIEAYQRRVSWKDEFISRLGEDEANLVVANTPYSERLVVKVNEE